MNKARLFDYLKSKDSIELVQLLENCYDCMKTQQITDVFSQLEKEIFKKNPLIDGDLLLKEVGKFNSESQHGVYFAPFDINSKNYMDVPEETQMWFEKLGDLLTESTLLSQQNHHQHAVRCFRILYRLIEDPLLSEQIVFADELGMWMLPIKEEPCIEAFLRSAAAVFKPQEYVEVALQMIGYDRGSSYNAYKKAIHLANEAQKTLLEEEIIRQKIIIK